LIEIDHARQKWNFESPVGSDVEFVLATFDLYADEWKRGLTHLEATVPLEAESTEMNKRASDGPS